MPLRKAKAEPERQTHQIDKLKLPRLVEADPRYQQLQQQLVGEVEKLWSGSSLTVPVISFSPALEQILVAAHEKKRLVRGLDSIERVLQNEARGLRMVDQKSGEKRTRRISRLLIMSNDGADRLYRKVETLLREHGDRVLALRITADSQQLGSVFGPEKLVKLLLVEHKEDVAALLLALLV